MEKNDNQKKLKALKNWLKENNITFVDNHVSDFGVKMEVMIPKLNIAVFLSDGNKDEENKKYNAGTGKRKLFRVYRPFFIRESESLEFVLEKLQNCCFDRMMWLQKTFENKNKKQK